MIYFVPDPSSFCLSLSLRMNTLLFFPTQIDFLLVQVTSNYHLLCAADRFFYLRFPKGSYHFMNPFCGLIAWLAFQQVSNIQKCEPVPLYHILCCDATFGFRPELVIWPVVAKLLESTDSYISILLVAINLLIQHL